MRPTTVTIFEMFQMERRYLVPLFQREYIWKQADQWEPLWEDITLKADEWLRNDPETKQQLRTHFLGAVVLDLIATYGKNLSARAIIDGQQRLTTLQIVLFALRDFATEHCQQHMLKRLGKI